MNPIDFDYMMLVCGRLWLFVFRREETTFAASVIKLSLNVGDKVSDAAINKTDNDNLSCSPSLTGHQTKRRYGNVSKLYVLF